MPKKEEYIEGEILAWLNSIGINAEKIVNEGYYNEKQGRYQARKSRFIPLGMSDIVGIMPNGRYLAIEVKTPEEMQFFDRSLKELIERESDAIERFGKREIEQTAIKKYTHAVYQKRFLISRVDNGGIAFFASSVEECIEKFASFGVTIE